MNRTTSLLNRYQYFLILTSVTEGQKSINLQKLFPPKIFLIFSSGSVFLSIAGKYVASFWVLVSCKQLQIVGFWDLKKKSLLANLKCFLDKCDEIFQESKMETCTEKKQLFYKPCLVVLCKLISFTDTPGDVAWLIKVKAGDWKRNWNKWKLVVINVGNMCV